MIVELSTKDGSLHLNVQDSLSSVGANILKGFVCLQTPSILASRDHSRLICRSVQATPCCPRYIENSL